jgi:hypothetical protein
MKVKECIQNFGRETCFATTVPLKILRRIWNDDIKIKLTELDNEHER